MRPQALLTPATHAHTGTLISDQPPDKLRASARNNEGTQSRNDEGGVGGGGSRSEGVEGVGKQPRSDEVNSKQPAGLHTLVV
jgi:hypothetical protein